MSMEFSSPARASVLIVDDNAANLLALESVLEVLGQRIVQARSGEEALKHVLDEEFAVILLDMRMPGMDGIETARAIKQRAKSRHTPIIFLTAEPTHRAEGYESGAVDYVTKPYEPEIVRSKVAVFVELYQRGLRIREQEARLAQKEVEAATLRTREEQYRWLKEVLDRLPTPLMLVDLAGSDVTFTNAAAREANVASCDVLGRVVAGEELAGVECNVRGGGGGGPEAAPRTFMAFSASVPAMHGHEPAAVLSFVDVTDLKRVERELKDAVSVRDDFLSIASHELHTPLTPLKLQIERMRRKPHSSEQMGEKLAIVDRQVDRMIKLVTQLLDVSRIAGGKLRLRAEEVDLGAVVKEVAEATREALTRTGSELVLDLPKAPVRGMWDRTRIEQIVTNLVSNAVKYGGGKPILIAVTEEGGRARLTVRDHGIGIPNEQLSRIFDRFERAVSVRHFGGFGLGLWIVRQIVEASGGTVRVESTLAEGSCFVVELPSLPSTGA